MENEPKNGGGNREEIPEVIEQYLEKTLGKAPNGKWGKLIGPATGEGYLSQLAYYKEETTPPQWHYVSSGFSEMMDDAYEGQPEPAEDFELTFRLLQKEGEKAPGQWPFRTFETFAANLMEANSTFVAYDYTEFESGGIDADEKNEFTGGVFVPDTELPTLKTAMRNISFLQFVPLTEKELDVFKKLGAQLEEKQDIEAYNKAAQEFVEKLKSATNPLLVTELDRKSIV
jgi:Suppressor of fused protein (SUFU)